ncbi:hypothetical protein [Bacillus massiliglaciei]|uniref:hypothetical protein n=1 Tax=Bacillus massiliglaciei TaxID=1816693 RepID=UPI000AFD5674|nr:hypothetical protein [Bacillus massiliglaciei]
MDEFLALPFIDNLIGKQVQISLDGSETQEGILISVETDYLVLYSNSELTFLALAPITSVQVNSRSTAADSEETLELLEGMTDFPETLADLTEASIGKLVRVNDGSTSSYYGRIVETQEDFFALSTEDQGLLFYQYHFVNSFTFVKEDTPAEVPTFEREFQFLRPAESPSVPESSGDIYDDLLAPETEAGLESDEEVAAPPSLLTFDQLLARLDRNWVTIRLEESTIDGLIIETETGYVVLVNGEELYYVPTEHIQSLGLGVMAEQPAAPAPAAAEETAETTETAAPAVKGVAAALAKSRVKSNNTFKKMWIDNLMKVAEGNTPQS